MKSIRLKSLILLALVPLLLLGIGSCKRTVKKDETFGQNLVSAPPEFTGIVEPGGPSARRHFRVLPPTHPFQDLTFDPISPSPDNFQFGREAAPGMYGGDLVYFKNTFSHDVTWFIKMKGLISGAEKNFSGTGKSLDSNVVYWDGGTDADGLRFFIKGETITYEISFLGSAVRYTGNLLTLDNTSSGPKRYHKFKYVKNGGDSIYYFMVDDMGDSGFAPGAQGIRVSYMDANDYNNAQFYTIVDKQVDGRFSYYMKGTDYSGNSYCGGFGGEVQNELYYSTDGESDPSKVYINAYIYGYGRPNSALTFLLFENDFWTPGVDAIPTVKPDPLKNDMWISIVQVNWTGWKLVSIPYSSFRSANDPKAGGSGNRIREPHKLAGMGVELDSYPVAGQTAELAIDAIYITTHAAFQP